MGDTLVKYVTPQMRASEQNLSVAYLSFSSLINEIGDFFSFELWCSSGERLNSCKIFKFPNSIMHFSDYN